LEGREFEESNVGSHPFLGVYYDYEQDPKTKNQEKNQTTQSNETKLQNNKAVWNIMESLFANLENESMRSKISSICLFFFFF